MEKNILEGYNKKDRVVFHSSKIESTFVFYELIAFQNVKKPKSFSSMCFSPSFSFLQPTFLVLKENQVFKVWIFKKTPLSCERNLGYLKHQWKIAETNEACMCLFNERKVSYYDLSSLLFIFNFKNYELKRRKKE